MDEERPEPDRADRETGTNTERHPDLALFEQAMEGVVPLADRSRRLTRVPRGGHGPPRPGRRHRRLEFQVERTGDAVSGRLEGVEPSVVSRLRGGVWQVEMRVELHGYPELEARGTVRDAVERAARAGLRCLLLVHGRGLRSPGGPVLKEAIPRWLTRPPLARRVVAFASASPRLGGSGATLVLLRKKRDGSR